MSYRVEQKIKGKIYVYEVKSFWDKSKQQARQKRTYLGRKDEKTGKIVLTSKNSIVPKGSYKFGSFFLLKNLSDQINLTKVLKKVFPYDYKKYLSVVFYKVIQADPYYLYTLWEEETYTFSNIGLDSQRISEMLLDIGKNEKQIEVFFSNWINEQDNKYSVMFDISSISSYSKNNELVERGYNRDKENLGQTNLGIISRRGKNSIQLPLAYRIYPGSISDVVTLKNIIKLIKYYKLNVNYFVMDRGFYSKENIREMNNKELKFLLPLVFTTRKAKQLVYDFDEEISKPICSFLYNENVYSHVRTKVEINGVMCVAHIFLDKERRAREESLLIRKMSYLESIFSEKGFKDEISAEEYIKETMKSKRRFFKVKKRNKRVTIERDEVFLKEAVMQMGKFIFITNERGLDRKDVLSLYRSRDGIERLFRSFKHDILEKRSRVKSSTSMKGSVFINFLALILISHIDKIMNQEKLYKKVTKKELFRTLDQLKVYHLANDKIILAEVSKRQKEIFSAFKLLKKLKPSYNSTGF